ncbi:MAG: L-serine ammonia-lyase, iron-sulfur-dependent, subunit alpha [Eubacteriales bacterium]|nr:L-serine ammonia-lyase, iron-sulfur-dependent, subunit alpha [Eubacteriales bacterium]
MTQYIYDNCISILKEELVPAMGCTEPIAIAYCAAKLRETLGEEPDKVTVLVSGNILKNVKSVVVPNTGGRKGIKTAVAAGIVAGEADKELEVIASVPEAKLPEIEKYVNNCEMEVKCLDTPWMLDIFLTGYKGEHKAAVRISNGHKNIVYIEKDGEVLFEKEAENSMGDRKSDLSVLSLDNIYEFAETVDLELVVDVLKRQLDYNTAISAEGFNGNWGANIGKLMMEIGEGRIELEAAACAAAGSDARMSGCEMPVIILSGSGNQGMTASLPVYRYAKELGVSEDKMYRALIISDLVTVFQKRGIGLLSAYCGAVSAGVGAGAGIAYLNGADKETIGHTIENAVAILSGTICDGAKPSCAAKIASAVNAGILGHKMAKSGNNFGAGEGIIGNDIEDTVENVGILAAKGMKETDRVILDIMTK